MKRLLREEHPLWTKDHLWLVLAITLLAVGGLVWAVVKLTA